MIERLEFRVAPAVLTGNVLTYTDVDNDAVTVTIKTKAALAQANFTFAGGFLPGDAATPQQLQLIDLSADVKNDGASITAVVTQAGGGDGKVNIGAINATGSDLKSVTIPGDLGRILCGDAKPDPALGKLTVDSMGILGTATQAGGGSLSSMINGPLKSMTVAGNFAADMAVEEIAKPAGLLGKVVIGGDLDGASQNDGNLSAEGDIGTVVIKGKITGGSNSMTGRLVADTKIGKVIVGVPAPHGEPPPTAVVMHGNGTNSAVIEAVAGDIGSVTIYGSVQGGGQGSAQIVSGGASIKKVVVTGDFIGGSGTDSGEMNADHLLSNVFIGGNLQGGTASSSGFLIGIDGVGKIKVAGSVIGGSQSETGCIDAEGPFKSVEVDGSITGGGGQFSGCIFGAGIGKVLIKTDLTAGTSVRSGLIVSGQEIGSVSILGKVTGTAAHNAVIMATSAAKPGKAADVAIKSVKIGGDATFLDILAGYNGSNAADFQPLFDSHAQIGSVAIGGNVSGVNIAAGVDPVDGKFGNGNDTVPAGSIASIGKIVVTGMVNATADMTDSFAFTSHLIKAATINGVKLALKKGPGNDNIPLAAGDTVLQELP